MKHFSRMTRNHPLRRAAEKGAKKRMFRLHPNILEPARWATYTDGAKMMYLRYETYGLLAQAALEGNDEATVLCRGFYKLLEQLEAGMAHRHRKTA